jgi:3',5'-cyclic AMP phosphodiesterase CpdA
LKFPVISASGNHDYDHGGQRLFEELLGKNEFAFGSYNSYFIILDDNEGNLSEAQLKWFEKELKKGSSYAHRFVFMHKAPINPYQQSWYRIDKSAWTKPFMKLCEDYRVDIVFSGHEHIFKENDFNGVKYITTGGGGMLPTIPSCDGGYIHYVSVNVNGPYASYEVRRVTPPVWLCLVYYVWKDLLYTMKGFAI